MNSNSLCPRLHGRRMDAEPALPKKTQQQRAPRGERTFPANLLTAATMLGAVLATAALVAGCASTAGVKPASQALMQPAQAGATAADT